METLSKARCQSGHKLSRFVLVALVGLVRLYQVAVSPWLGRNCRFEPTCSHYAIDALRTQGLARGTLLGFLRVCKCHPWHKGGYDPVPSPKIKTDNGVSLP